MVDIELRDDRYRVKCSECGEAFELPVSDLKGILTPVPDEVLLRHALVCVCDIPACTSNVVPFPTKTHCDNSLCSAT